MSIRWSWRSGRGRGRFLVAIAEAKREHNFIGIEWAKAYADFAADRLRRHELANARMVHGEASVVGAVSCAG